MPFVVPLPIMFLGVIIGTLQALIFVKLTMITCRRPSPPNTIIIRSGGTTDPKHHEGHKTDEGHEGRQLEAWFT